MTSEEFWWTKIIHFTIAKSSFTVLYNMTFDSCEKDTICFDRMVVEQWLEFDMKRDL